MSTLKRASSQLDSDGDDGDQVPQASTSTSTKRTKAGPSSSKPLDSWLAVSLPKPPSGPIGTSKPLHDVDSTFVAWACQAESSQDIKRLRNWILEVANSEIRDEPPSHTAHGARILSLKPGKTGLKEDDFEIKTFREDDGESRAGMTIVDTLASQSATDVCCIVSRWFGGTMLGPRRFSDISKVVLEALYSLRDAEALAELRETLLKKDTQISSLLTEIARFEGKETLLVSSSGTTPGKGTSIGGVGTGAEYEDLDLGKAKRLLAAREMRLKNLQGKLDKLKAEEEETLPEIPGKKAPSTSGT